MPWHANREEVFAVMRQVDEMVHHAWCRARDLSPKNGEIAWGSQDFDYTLRATIGGEYLRTLSKGGDPIEAMSAAATTGKDAIRKWNDHGSKARAHSHGNYELHRDPCAAESIALSFHLRFSEFIERPTQIASGEPESIVRFKNAIVDGTSYCGPICISALIGIGTKDVATLLRHQFKIKAVRGLLPSLVVWFLEQAQYRCEELKPGAIVMRRFCEAYKGSRDVFLIVTPEHFLLWKIDCVICTQFGGKIGPLGESEYLDKKICNAYRITGEVDLTAVSAALKKIGSRKTRHKCSDLQATLF